MLHSNLSIPATSQAEKINWNRQGIFIERMTSLILRCCEFQSFSLDSSPTYQNVFTVMERSFKVAMHLKHLSRQLGYSWNTIKQHGNRVDIRSMEGYTGFRLSVMLSCRDSILIFCFRSISWEQIYQIPQNLHIHWYWLDLGINFHKFITDLWPLIDVGISFPINFFRTNWQNLTKFCICIDIDKI